MALAVVISVSLILRRRDPVKTLSWVMVLILLPYIGIICYLLVGQNFRKRKIYSRKWAADYKMRKNAGIKQLDEFMNTTFKPNPQLEEFKRLILQNLRNSHTLLENNQTIDFFFTGRDALEAMYHAIEEAANHIHLQSYIIENDHTGRRFKELLIKKAKQGLDVKVLFDGVGSIKLNRPFIKEMREAGVEVIIFAPLRIIMPTSKINYRNHRKILVVDGKTGFLGGVNIADRYFYGTLQGDWHDTHIRIVGQSVLSLQSIFLMDRHFALNRRFRFKKKYYPMPEITLYDSQEGNNYYSQIISSGPDSDWASIMQCYFSAITLAKEHIYIVTPYFTPCESILNAIKIAALGGIDVRIMLPEKSDTRLAQWSTMSYVGELLEAGVRIYLFKEGFNHSKVITIDGKMSIVGSANMDIRSFEHNFEVMAVIYNSSSSKIIENKFIDDMKSCTIMTKNKWNKRSNKEKAAESFARLCAPLL